MQPAAMSTQALASAYLAEWVNTQAPLGDVHDYVRDLTARDPELAWQVILEMVQLGADDRAQMVIGDQAVRELLMLHPDTFGPRVIAATETNPALSECLGYCRADGLQFNLWQWLTGFQERGCKP